MTKSYKIRFTISEPAVITVQVKDGHPILEAFNECTTAERVTKIKHTIEKAGFQIVNIEKIDIKGE